MYALTVNTNDMANDDITASNSREFLIACYVETESVIELNPPLPFHELRQEVRDYVYA